MNVLFLFYVLLIASLIFADVCQEGIFRRSGKITRQQELKSLLNQGVPLNLDDGHFSVHDCASVLKNFLAELPESLLTDAHYPAYCQIAGKVIHSVFFTSANEFLECQYSTMLHKATYILYIVFSPFLHEMP
jgi:hypothetical protein